MRALNFRDQETLSEEYHNWHSDDEQTVREWYRKHVEFLYEHIDGWDNMINTQTGENVPFSKDAILDVMGREEVVEYIRMFLNNAHLDDMEKKSSGLPPASIKVNSANNAKGNAKTLEPIASP